MNTNQQQTAISIAAAFGFRQETRTDAEIAADVAREEEARAIRRSGRLLVELATRRAAEMRAEAARQAKAAELAKETAPQSAEQKPVIKGVIVPADPAETERIRAANAEAERRQAERKARQAESEKPIPAEILAAGLKADIEAEAKRRQDEANEAERLAEGYRADVFRTALTIASNGDSVDVKMANLESAGFTHVGDSKNGRDAEFHHQKADVTFYLRGAATGVEGTSPRPKKARGSELVKLTAEDHARNRALKLAAKLARKPAPKAEKQKAEKKPKDDGKKNKKAK